MEISMKKLEQEFERLALNEVALREEEIFLDIIFSSVVSIKSLKEKGYTPELLLSIAAKSDMFVDSLERMDASVMELSENILTAPAISKGARKLF